MKRTLATIVLICATALFVGCRSPEPTGQFSKMNREMARQMKAVRAQMQAAGATEAQLRDFDRQMAEMSKQMKNSMNQMDKQMRAMKAAEAH